MALASNSSKLYKSYTVILAVILFIAGLFEKLLSAGMLESLQPYMTATTFTTFSMVTSVLIIVARYIKQSGLVPEELKDSEDQT